MFNMQRDELRQLVDRAAVRPRFKQMMTLVEELSKGYHAFCSYAQWLCRDSGLDYKNDPDIGPIYDAWKAKTITLEMEYQKIRQDHRFHELYSLEQRRMLGVAFATEL
jgi:hypothetical protein